MANQKLALCLKIWKGLVHFFKLALRYCKNYIDEIKADACADMLMDKDCRKFWNQVYKISNNKAAEYVGSIGDVSGSENVTEM